MRTRGRLAGAALCLALAAALPAAADEITDQIHEALRLYEAGDHQAAAGELEMAAMQIRQLRAGAVSDALPAPLSGWEGGEIETEAMPGMAMGGASAASREYTKGRAEVEVQIMADSPMMQGLAMMLSNPMILANSGKKLIKVHGNKAILDYDAEDQRGEMQIVAGTVLVTVDGHHVTQEDLQAYAEAVDYGLIAKLASGN